MEENEKGKNTFVIIVVVVLAALGVFLYVKSQTGLKPIDNTSEKTETSGETSQSTVAPSDTIVQGTEAKIEIKGFAFSPAIITVKVGTKVTWTNQDSVAHTATSDDSTTFDTGLLNQGESGSFTFDKVGTYEYHCTPHPRMTAKIIVVE